MPKADLDSDHAGWHSAVTVFDPAFPAAAGSAEVCRSAKLQGTDLDSALADSHLAVPAFDPVFQAVGAWAAADRSAKSPQAGSD